MNITYTNTITADEVNSIRASVGFRQIHPELIPNILVAPEYQMQGIETEMINHIFDFLRSKLKPGFGIQVDIKAFNNTEYFYENLGFQISTPQMRGVPMHICLTNQIEYLLAVH